MKDIYLDNSASTPTDSRVLKVVADTYKKYGNPSSFNNAGRLARKDMEQARLVVARFLGARPEEVIFTSSGSEANNLALRGVLENCVGGVVLTTSIEHLSVLEPLKKLSNIDIKYIPTNKEGLIDLGAFEKILSPQCRLVSVMYANNEIGTIEPIRKISKAIRDFNKVNGSSIFFHVDACQAAGYLDMNVQHLGVDFLTFNGSKIYGPRGVGVLYIRRGIKISPIILGGSQERGLRAGTENVPALVGVAKAILLIESSEAKRVATLRDYGIREIKKTLPEAIINGAEGENRLPNNISVCVSGLTSEVLLLELDNYGISAGSGSACTSHAVEPSHVLKAIGVSNEYINGALRFSLGRETTKKDIDYLIKTLAKIVPLLARRYTRLK